MASLAEIAARAAGREQEMLRALREMVRIGSGSRNKAGVDRLGSFIRTLLAGHELEMETVAQEELGDHLLVRSRGRAAFPRGILLVGHMDTVFPADSSFTEFTEDETRCYGPGVIDMKGGLAAGLFALKTLDGLGLLHDLPVTFVLNSDEEVGSPTSTPLIRREAERSAFAFVLEAGGLGGEVVTGRKGNMAIELLVEGVSGHAAFAGRDKASAVLELAHKIVLLEALNDPEAGVTVNVGRIEGGAGHNTVAARAEALLDCRFVEPAQGERLFREVERICAKSACPGTRCRPRIRTMRPPMPTTTGSAGLCRVFAELGRELDCPVGEEFRVGVSDANTIAVAGTPVLDGLGPLGAGDHSEREYMLKASLAARTQLLACGLVACWERYLAGGFF